MDDVLKYGAFYQEDNSLAAQEKKIQEADEKVAELEKRLKEARTTAPESVRSAGMSGASYVNSAQKFAVDSLSKDVETAKRRRDELQSQYNEAASDLIRKIREEQTTEAQKAVALRKQYENLLKYTKTDEDRAAIEAKIKSIDDGIADSKAKELAEQEKRLADQRAALAKDLGISLDFAPVKSQVDAMADDLAKLSEAFHADPDMFGGVEGALEEAESNPTK